MYSHTVVAPFPQGRLEHVYIHLEYIDILKVKLVFTRVSARADFVGFFNRRLDMEYDTEAELFRSMDASYRPVVSNHITVAYRR